MSEKPTPVAISETEPDLDAVAVLLPAREGWERSVNRVVLCYGELPTLEGSTTLASDQELNP